MKKFISCILTIAIVSSLNIQAFATGDAGDYLQSNINTSNDTLKNDSKADELIKEMTKLSRSTKIFENEQQGYILNSIEIVGGLKDTYIQGQKINVSELKAEATYIKPTVSKAYTDTKIEPITIIEEDIKGFDTNTIGEKTLVIEINQVKAEKQINVTEKVLKSIWITKNPTKFTYMQGETLDLTGLEVIGTYNDGSSRIETVTLNNILDFDSEQIGYQTLTVEIKGKRDTFQIEVIENKLQSIAITNKPTKLIYIQGETLDLTGLEVTGTYANGSSRIETVTLNNILGFNSEQIGMQTLTVEIKGMQSIFEIEVIENKLQSIAITNKPTKLIYIQGETLDLTGLEVTGTYANGIIKIETITLNNILGFDSQQIGMQTLTVTVGQKTTVFEIEIQKKELPPETNDIKIETVQYTPAVGFEAQLKVTLNKPTNEELTLKDFSIHCPGLGEMTIASVSNATGMDKNRIYTLKLASYKDNNYTLEVTLNRGKPNEKILESEFLVKYTNCPIIGFPYAIRTSSTEAQFKFSSDGSGKLYYLFVPNNNYSRGVKSEPTVDDVKKANNLVDIKAAPLEIKIGGLSPNIGYSIYYLTAKDGDETLVYGPVEIPAKPETSTSKITITEAKVLGTDSTQSVQITFSEPTPTVLQIKDFEIKCPADSNLMFEEIKISPDRKIYTLVMYGGFRDNNYEVKVNFPDGTFIKGNFKCELETPTISGVSPIRTSETTATITFNSTAEGILYYGVSQEAYKKPSVAEIVATGKTIKIHENRNTIYIEGITMKDKHFYWLAESKSGSRPYFVNGGGESDFSGRIPDKIEEVEKPVDTDIKITTIDVLKDTKGNNYLKVTFNKNLPSGSTTFKNVEIWNENVSWMKKNLIVDWNSTSRNVVQIKPWGDTKFLPDTYTIAITFDDGINTKEFTIK